MTDDFPNNSQRAGQEVPPEVNDQIEKIIDGTAIIRKPSGFRRFRRSFIAGDASTVGEHVFWNLLIPSAKDALSDMAATFIDMMIYGEKRNRLGSGPIQGPGSTSKINYGGISSANRVQLSPQHDYSQPAIPHRLDPTQITMPSRPAADKVIEQMFDRLTNYKVVTVAELYRMLGHSPDYTDNKWGWTDLSAATIRRHRGDVQILLPQPEDLD